MASKEWKKLFTKDVEAIWNEQRSELRNFAMVFYVLKREFNKIENNLNSEMTNFKRKFEMIDNCKELDNETATSVTLKDTNNEDIEADRTQLHLSPKINRHRTLYFKKHVSPSLLEASKENIVEPPIKSQTESLIFEFPKMKELNSSPTKNKLDCLDVIDCSIIEDDKPELSIVKKVKRHKVVPPKVSRNIIKQKNISTITQIFENISQIKNIKSNCKEETKSIFSFNNGRKSEKNSELKTRKTTTENISDVKHVLKNKSPEYPYKMDPIRRKADRLKLPGWSCTDCQKYYEGLNLTPNELQQKLNMCSKHRNKFEPLNETPAGYWDITIGLTEDNSTDNSDFR